MSFRNNPSVRFWVRTLVVAALGYLNTTLVAGVAQGFDYRAFLFGLLGTLVGAAYAAVGAATPVEPKVGVKTDVNG